MLKSRIITGVILLVLFAADLASASVDVFALSLSFVVAAAGWEWGRMCGIKDETVQTAFASIVGLLALIILYLPYNVDATRWVFLVAFLFWASVPAMFYLAPRLVPITKIREMLLLTGVFIFIVSVLAIQDLRSYVPFASSWFLLYVMSIVWLMDIGAYFSGRRFGANKLAPAISPGKTWEGVYGGLAVTAAVLIVVLIVAPWAPDNRLKLVIATALAAAASVIGDLYESRIKRAADMKDSSQLLPGHGGVLDRIDGVLAALPVFVFVWVWL
ncbi:MAG: phosphatidate cytidylyltransferase [Porticoccaceae bacterium]|jgi:phosphatidate cytidylyltransferase